MATKVCFGEKLFYAGLKLAQNIDKLTFEPDLKNLA